MHGGFLADIIAAKGACALVIIRTLQWWLSTPRFPSAGSRPFDVMIFRAWLDETIGNGLSAWGERL